VRSGLVGRDVVDMTFRIARACARESEPLGDRATVEHEFELREDETGSGGSAAFLRSRPARRLPGWG
jgi:hypothetical protein